MGQAASGEASVVKAFHDLYFVSDVGGIGPIGFGQGHKGCAPIHMALLKTPVDSGMGESWEGPPGLGVDRESQVLCFNTQVGDLGTGAQVHGLVGGNPHRVKNRPMQPILQLFFYGAHAHCRYRRGQRRYV